MIPGSWIMNRRRLFKSLAVASSGSLAQGQQEGSPIDALRNVSHAHGIELNDDRLRILEPILRQRKTQLQAVRDFDIDDSVEPTNGCL